jgi:hypothetical protein
LSDGFNVAIYETEVVEAPRSERELGKIQAGIPEH